MDEATIRKIEIQREYCEESKLPFFAPTNDNSWCCHRNIWEKITEEKASSELITGCPRCHRSFCD